MGKKSKRNKRSSAAASTNSTSGTNDNNDGKGRSKSTNYNASAANSGSVAERLSRRGLCNPFTPTTQEELDAIITKPIVSSNDEDPIKPPKDATCWICLEGIMDDNTEPLRRNCACRGDNNYAHLKCLVSLATSKSEDIWTGRVKAASNSDWLAFGWVWESCQNCKQYFAGKLRLDIANEYARSTEGMVGGVRAYRHIVACSWVTKSMFEVHNPCYSENYVLMESKYDKLLDLIHKTYPIYNQGINPALQYINFSLKRTEAETITNYSQTVASRIRMLDSISSVKSEELTKLYNKWNDLSSQSVQRFEDLEETIFGKDPIMMQQLKDSILHVKSQMTYFKREFSHLSSEGLDGAVPDEKEVSKLSEQLKDAYIKERGETSTDAIRFSLIHAQKMIMSQENWKPYDALATGILK